MKILYLYFCFFSIVNLTAQTLTENKGTYKSLDSALTNWSEVLILDLSYKQLSDLPETVGNLKNLRKLNIKGNNLKTLPKSIEKLIKLNELVLS